jgi:hypothetical protein
MKQTLRGNFSIERSGNWIARHKDKQVVQLKQMALTQTDGFNCGMFIIMYMDTLVKSSFVDATSFSASEMPNYRLKLAKAITRGKIK